MTREAKCRYARAIPLTCLRQADEGIFVKLSSYWIEHFMICESCFFVICFLLNRASSKATKPLFFKMNFSGMGDQFLAFYLFLHIFRELEGNIAFQ